MMMYFVADHNTVQLLWGAISTSIASSNYIIVNTKPHRCEQMWNQWRKSVNQKRMTRVLERKKTDMEIKLMKLQCNSLFISLHAK